MSSRIGPKKGLWIGGLAVAVVLVFTAIPGLAASSTRTIDLAITSPASAAANTPGVIFHAKITNNSPVGSVSNPSSVRVTVPTGFTVTGASLATKLSGESSNLNTSALVTWTGSTATANSINPLQRTEYVTVLITATTPDLSTCGGSGTASGTWSAGASTGSTFGTGGQPFTLTTNPLPTTLLTKDCSAPTIKIDNTTPVGTLQQLTTRTYSSVGVMITFYAAATGLPTPTITWQSSPDNGTWTNVGTPSCGSGNTCSFTTVIGSDGTYYRATASNGISPDGSSNVIQIAYAAPCGTAVGESGGGTSASVVLVKNPVNTDDATTCDPKPFSLVVGQRSIQVLPTGTACSLTPLNTCATYVVYSDAWAPEPSQTVVPATIVSPTGNPPSTSGSEAEVWCAGTYVEADAPSPSNTDGTYGMDMPDGHTWCRIIQTTTPAGYALDGNGDPILTQPLMQVSEISLLIGDATRIRGT